MQNKSQPTTQTKNQNTPKIRFKNFSDEWNAKILGEICEYKNGKSYEPFICDNGKYNLITLNSVDINGKLKIEHKKILNADEFLIKDDLVIVLSDIAIGSFLGLTAIIPNNNTYVLNQRMGLLRKTINLNAYFLSTLINSKQKYFFSIGQGTSQKNLSKFGVLNLSIKMPKNIKEQEKIGAFFSKLDKLITLHQRKCDTLKKVKKSMLQKMFPKNGASVPEICFAGFTGDWERRKLGEVAENTYGGGTPQTSVDSFWNGDIPWIQSQNIIENQLFDVVPQKYISEEAVLKSATKLIPKNSIAIVTRVGVGKLAFMPFSYCTSQDFLSLSGIRIDKKFAVYSIYKMLQKEKENVQGTSIKGITIEELLSKNIKLPCNNAEQIKIGTYFQNLDNLITLQQRKVEKLKNIKKALLNKMFI